MLVALWFLAYVFCMSRLIFLILGWCALILGAIGIILPVLPTTPFMILAAFLFTKGSPRMRAWLIEHAHFGPHITHWEREGAIAPRAKRIAVSVMTLVFAASVVLGAPWWVLLIQGACMGPAAVFIWTRPDPKV